MLRLTLVRLTKDSQPIALLSPTTTMSASASRIQDYDQTKACCPRSLSTPSDASLMPDFSSSNTYGCSSLLPDSHDPRKATESLLP